MADLQQGPIYFYGAEEKPYGCFSNFSRHGFHLDGKYWPTSEHYFQAQKFAGTPHLGTILRAESPRDAARMGRSRKRPLRPDWEAVKEDVMRQAVYAKFAQNLDICQILLDTGNQHLVENSPVDYTWGCGKDGSGQNRLGHILVELRERLRQEGFPRVTRHLHKTKPMPAARVQISYNRTFSPDEYRQLRRGFASRDMDDRWFIFLEDDWLYFHRSWTGYCIYQVRLEASDECYAGVEAWVNRNPEQFNRADVTTDGIAIDHFIDMFLLTQ